MVITLDFKTLKLLFKKILRNFDFNPMVGVALFMFNFGNIFSVPKVEQKTVAYQHPTSIYMCI